MNNEELNIEGEYQPLTKSEKNQFQGGFGEVGANTLKPNVNHSLTDDKKVCNNADCSMKWNRYNIIKRNNDKEYVLYNSSTDRIMVMVEEVKRILIDNMNSVNLIAGIHPELYHFLIKNKFIVNDRFDEVKDVIRQMKKKVSSPDYFELIINPTLDCNLRCWYCYEAHQKNSVVSDDTLMSILCLIKNIVESPKLMQLHISFFGGEPLIKFDQVLWPVIKFAQKLCMDNNKKLSVGFTTNGVLLTRQMVDQLYAAELSCTFQVPFDGNREFHNKTKKYVNGKGAYDRTIRNVMYALSKGFRFIIRCNYTPDNLHSFDELISVFSDVAEVCIEYGLLLFSFQKVWQVGKTAEMEKVVGEYEGRTQFLDTSFERCYADKENSVIINYNGDVYNCTGRDFRPENREGYLSREGKIIYNEKHKKRMEARFSNHNCQNCSLFPICNTCSQKKLEQQNKNFTCLGMVTGEDKERLLLTRIRRKSDRINSNARSNDLT